MSQEIGCVTLSHGTSLVIILITTRLSEGSFASFNGCMVQVLECSLVYACEAF